MNEAAMKRAASASSGEGSDSQSSKKAAPERDQKRVNEPIYTSAGVSF